MKFLKLWILKLTLKLLRRWHIVSFLTLITHSQTQGFPDRWKLGLSDEEMTDTAKHHLGLTNFKGIIPKDHIPVFTQYVIEEAAPYEQSTVAINTARDSEPGKHWVALHYQPPTDYWACEMDVWWNTSTLMEWLTCCLKSTNLLKKCIPLTPGAIIL